jgi:small subunit ribosomal protein S8
VIEGLKRVSIPSRRVYVAYDRIPRVMSGLGINILSTSRGIMSDRRARQQQVGGEILCSIW